MLIALISVAAILIFMGINQRWFAKDYHFESRFNSGEGLKRGMPVKLKGFRIGMVDSVELLPDNTAAIRFHVFDTYYSKVREHSVLELVSSPLGIGGGGLLFHPGNPEGDLLQEGAHIPSLDFEAGRGLVERGLVATLSKEDAVSSAVREIGPLMSTARTSLEDLSELINTVNRSLEGQETGPLSSILANTDRLLIRANSVSAALEETLGHTSAVVQDMRSLSSQLKETRGLAKRLLDPQGSFAKILDDDALHRRLTGVLTQLESITGELRSFTGYLNSQQSRITTLIEKGDTTLDRGEEVLEGLRNNPLLRGGISEEAPIPSTVGGMRDGEF